MAPPRDAGIAGTPAPRALIVANLLAFVIAIITLAIAVPPRLRQHQEQARRDALLMEERRFSYDGKTPLHTVAQRGNISRIRALLKDGARLDSKDRHGYTPLHDAALGGNVAALRLLLQAGARLDERTSTGDTPLQVAEKNYHPEAAKFLRAEAARRAIPR
jgi:hypothetical protein